MVRALAVHHGIFGRIAIYRFCEPMVSHAHREAHLTFLLDGPESNMPVEGQAGPLTEETVVGCSPWREHAFKPGSLFEPSTFLVLYVSPTWFAQRESQLLSGILFGTHLFYRTQKIKGYVNRLTNLLMMGDTSDLIEGYIYELTRESFNESLRVSNSNDKFFSDHRRLSDYRVRRSIETMKNKVGNTMIIEEIAASSGLSRAHFFKLFKENTGLSPNIYLNTLRVEESLRQIVNPRQTIGTISENLGFSSQASFSRFFTSHVGLAPGEYRQFAAI